MNADMSGALLKCSKCRRQVLVERGLIGVDHTMAVIVTCWDCLDKKEQQKAKEMYCV